MPQLLTRHACELLRLALLERPAGQSAACLVTGITIIQSPLSIFCIENY